ncbi:MAG: TonB-dependent receptor [Halioglobus sp.]
MSNRTPLRKNAIARVVSQHRATLLAGAAAAALITPNLALAQQLEEVVVTAQKREANLQDTSLSVQVLGSEQLENLNIQSFDDYVQFLPTVSFTTTRPGIAQVYMRGINSGGDGNHSASMPSVGVYLDEQPITTINEVLDLHMYDIARIETIAGPQGTLFGSSSQAGTLRIITNKPNNEFEATYDISAVSVEKGGSGGTAEGMVNIPMGDSVALRLVGWYDDAPGYIDNVPGEITYDGPGTTINNDDLVEKDFNETETTGARALLRIDLNEDWAITPGLTYQKMDSSGAFDHDPDDYGDLETTKFYDTFYDEEWYQASLTVEGRIGGLDLVYAGAYLERERDSQYDYSWYAEYYDNVTRPNSNSAYGYVEGDAYYWASYHYDEMGNPVESSQYVDQDEEWTRESHEIRLQSQEGRLRWIAGFFYQEQEHDFDLQWTAPAVGSDVNVVPGGPTVVWQTVQTRNDEEQAIFGEISFDFTDNLTALVGARYYDYDNSLYGFNGWSRRCTGYYDDNGNFVEDRDGTLQDPCYDTGNVDGKTSNDDVIGKANITYTVNDDALVYFTWSEGYRPGGVNRSNEAPPYVEDFVTNWELGWKTTWMDNRMRFNGATYFMDWEDFQYASLDLGSGQPLTVINNAGQAEIFGLEFDLDYAITNAFTFSFSGSFIDAESIDTIVHEDGIIPKGTKLPYTPEAQLSSVLRYGTELGEYGVYAQGSWSYSDGVTTDLRPEFALETDSYNIVNLAFGIARNSWHLDLFIDNATDERAELDNVDGYPLYDGNIKSSTFYSTNRPRSIGLRFGQKF